MQGYSSEESPDVIIYSLHTQLKFYAKKPAVFKHNLNVWNLERLQQEAGIALTDQEID